MLARMLTYVKAWEQANDYKAIFLRCYMMMTRNMLTALTEHEFNDPVWVDQLLHHFAEYYFVALDPYQGESTSAPAAW